MLTKTCFFLLLVGIVSAIHAADDQCSDDHIGSIASSYDKRTLTEEKPVPPQRLYYPQLSGEEKIKRRRASGRSTEGGGVSSSLGREGSMEVASSNSGSSSHRKALEKQLERGEQEERRSSAVRSLNSSSASLSSLDRDLLGEDESTKGRQVLTTTNSLVQDGISKDAFGSLTGASTHREVSERISLEGILKKIDVLEKDNADLRQMVKGLERNVSSLAGNDPVYYRILRADMILQLTVICTFVHVVYRLGSGQGIESAIIAFLGAYSFYYFFKFMRDAGTAVGNVVAKRRGN